MKSDQNINLSLKHLRTFAKPIIILFSTLIILGIIANIIVDNPYAHRIIRVAINEKVNQHTNLSLDFKALNIRVLPMEVNLYGFNLFVKNKQNEVIELASASHVHARVSLFSLMIGIPRLSIVEITDLQIKTSDFSLVEIHGSEQATETDKKDFSWPPDFPIPVSELSLQNASFNYIKIAESEEDTSVRLSVTGLDLQSDFDDWDDLLFGIGISSFSLVMDEREIFKRAKLSTELIFDEDIVSLDAIELSSQQLNTKGFVEGKLLKEKQKYVGLDVNGQLDVTGDLNLMGQLLDIPNTKGVTQGVAAIDVDLDWQNELAYEFEIGVEGKVQDGEIYEFKLLDSQAKLIVSKDKIDFTEIVLIDDTSEYGIANGEIAFNDQLSFSFNYSPRNLPLGKLLNALTLDVSDVDAKLEADNYVIAGQGFPFLLKTKGQIRLSEMRIPALHAPEEAIDSPRCLVDLMLYSDEDHIGFDGSEAKCFSHKDWPKVGDFAAEDAEQQYNDLSQLSVTGGIAYSLDTKKELHIKAQNFDLRLLSYFSRVRKTGSSAFDITISQPKGEFQVNGLIDAKHVQVAQVPLGEVSGEFIVDTKKIRLQNVVSKLDAKNQIKVNSFELGYEDHLPFKIDVIASNIPSTMIRPLFDDAFEGGEFFTFSSEFLTANLKGELLKPFAYQGRINGLLRNGETSKERIFDSLRFDVQAAEKMAQLKYFSYQIGNLVFNATGRVKKAEKKDRNIQTPKFWSELGLDFADEVKLNIGTTNKLIELSDDNEEKSEKFHANIHNIPIAGPLLKDIGLNGTLNINGALEGTFAGLSGTVQMGLNDFSMFSCSMAPIHVEAFLQGKKLDTIVRHSGNALTGRFSVDFSRESLPYTMYLKATRLDVRAFAPQPFYSDPRNYAYLTASLNLNGELVNWWNSIGEMSVSDLRVNYTAGFASEDRRVEMNLVEPIDVIIDKSGWNIRDEKRFALTGEYLKFSLGTGRNNPPEAVDVDFNGSVNLAGVELLSDKIESSSGNVIFNGYVKGNVEDPNFSMRVFNEKVRGNNVSIGLIDLRPSFDNIDFDITMDKERVILNRLSAVKGSGQISALGQVNLDPESTADSQIDVTFEDTKLVFPAPVVKLVEASVSGNIFIKNALPPYEINGNIIVDRGRTVGEIDPRKEIVEALRQQDYSSSTTSSDPFLALNINVTADNSLIVNNRNMQATLSSDLRITGSEIQPVVLGQVEINKGKFIYKRDFNLTQGLITFDDPVKLDPKLDINAIAEAQNYRVFIAVSGRASEPVVDLSTDPATRDDGSAITKLDIITLLSTGSLPDVNRNDISSQTVAQTEALNIFAGQLEEPVEKLFDLAGQKVVREVYIDTYAISGGRPLARLNMPLNLGKNWDMIFRVDQESWKLSSEYSLHENISILGSFDGRSEGEADETGQVSSGDTGVDVKFRFSFP